MSTGTRSDEEELSSQLVYCTGSSPNHFIWSPDADNLTITRTGTNIAGNARHVMVESWLLLNYVSFGSALSKLVSREKLLNLS